MPFVSLLIVCRACVRKYSCLSRLSLLAPFLRSSRTLPFIPLPPDPTHRPIRPLVGRSHLAHDGEGNPVVLVREVDDFFPGSRFLGTELVAREGHDSKLILHERARKGKDMEIGHGEREKWQDEMTRRDGQHYHATIIPKERDIKTERTRRVFRAWSTAQKHHMPQQAPMRGLVCWKISRKKNRKVFLAFPPGDPAIALQVPRRAWPEESAARGSLCPCTRTCLPHLRSAPPVRASRCRCCCWCRSMVHGQGIRCAVRGGYHINMYPCRRTPVRGCCAVRHKATGDKIIYQITI